MRWALSGTLNPVDSALFLILILILILIHGVPMDLAERTKAGQGMQMGDPTGQAVPPGAE